MLNFDMHIETKLLTISCTCCSLVPRPTRPGYEATHAAVKEFSFSGWQGFSEGWFELHSIVHAGNSGFETADNIVGNTAYIHMIGR